MELVTTWKYSSFERRLISSKSSEITVISSSKSLTNVFSSFGLAIGLKLRLRLLRECASNFNFLFPKSQ